MPKISVVMPVYNTEEEFLREAIESILNQTLGDFEFIIVNDCSTNNAEEVILSYNDDRIVYLKNEQNKGVSFSANLGLNTAKGKYVARMDSDDVAVKERLEIQYKFLEENSKYQLCGTRITRAKEKAPAKNMRFDYLKAKMFFRGNCLVQPTVMFNREFFINNSLYYNEEIPYGEDWDLWVRFSLIGKFVTIPERLLFYRQHPNSANKLFEDRYYEYSKKQFKKNLDILGFNFAPENEEIVLNFFAGTGEDKISFKDWRILFSGLLQILKLVKQNKKVVHSYAFIIILQKLISYTKYALISKKR